VHVSRWVDARAHLHWLFHARPLGALQLRGNLSPVWDQMLPALPLERWESNRRQVAT
jgi:hypothetical protein